MFRPEDLTARHLAKVVESSDDAIISKDLNSIITSWNPAAERIFGYTAAEAIGKSIRMIIPDELQSEEDLVLGKIKAGERVDHYETVRQRKDGARIHVSLTVSPILSDAGEVVGASKIARDVTERQRLLAEAQAANRVKDEFLAVLSHELRTPLNAILGFSRVVRSGMLPSDQVDRTFEIIERNARWLAQIVEDVLDVSRIVSGKIRLDMRMVDLRVVIDNAIASIQPAADAKGVRVLALIDPRVPAISADPDRLQQVVWNLLSNAIKFTPLDGVVQVRLERADSHVEIVVSDTGCGISRDFLPHVFERFRQADTGSTRRTGGLGLGLSIVRHLTEMLGGTVQVMSDGEGRGATFTVRLPSALVPISSPPGTRDYPPPMPDLPLVASSDLVDVHVLAVDDEGDSLALVKTVLESAGARVSTATSADTALALVQSAKPDVLVADLAMPDVDGFQLIKQVRALADPALANVPAVAVTAFARSEDRVKASQYGFEGHFAKPIDPGELIASVARLVRRHRVSK